MANTGKNSNGSQVKNVPKSFVIDDPGPGANVIELFLSVIYGFS